MNTKIEPVPVAAQATLLTAYLESTERYMKAIYNLAESLGALLRPNTENSLAGVGNGRQVSREACKRS
jgi:hypothetical protein